MYDCTWHASIGLNIINIQEQIFQLASEPGFQTFCWCAVRHCFMELLCL